MNRALHFITVMVLFGVFQAGCVTQSEVQNTHRPALITTQNSEGDVTISFKSEPGYTYSILYLDYNHQDKWRTLPNAQNIRGTGETIYIKDKVDPSLPHRRYWIKVHSQER